MIATLRWILHQPVDVGELLTFLIFFQLAKHLGVFLGLWWKAWRGK
jgi:hypothetical protein